jgi:insertion element IS1 protein InsB
MKNHPAVTATRLYSPRATLCAIGIKLRSMKLFDTLAEHVKIKQKVVRHTPVEKLTDAFNTYRELCWWGEHTSMYDKSETYSVEGDNDEFRHYLARLTRRSRCFSKCIEALRRAVELFVWCWNEWQRHR